VNFFSRRTMRPAASSFERRKLLLVNHFDLATVCGTTVMFGELLRLARHAAPEIDLAYAMRRTPRPRRCARGSTPLTPMLRASSW
jgi:hypothetical protein